MRRLPGCALGAALLFAVVAAPAGARPDGPLGPYLEHLERHLVLDWPAQGTLTDGFGPRWGRTHLGLDIGILRALDVRAAAGGVVSEVGWLDGYAGYGQVVLVDLPGGYRTLYAHLSQATVRVGQVVAAGERLGLAGCTGSCTGTHLHFELHDEGVAVDPLPFLAR